MRRYSPAFTTLRSLRGREETLSIVEIGATYPHWLFLPFWFLSWECRCAIHWIIRGFIWLILLWFFPTLASYPTLWILGFDYLECTFSFTLEFVLVSFGGFPFGTLARSPPLSFRNLLFHDIHAFLRFSENIKLHSLWFPRMIMRLRATTTDSFCSTGILLNSFTLHPTWCRHPPYFPLLWGIWIPQTNRWKS